MITITKIQKNVYVLKDRAECCANLVVGEEKALLFDTGSGIDDMYGAVRSITSFPLIVVNSHGHFDHIGGNEQFDKVYLSEKDFSILEGYQKDLLNKWRKEIAQGEEFPLFQQEPVRWKSIHRLDWEAVELGNMRCLAVPLEGHTRGSVGIWIPSLRLLLSGDALTPVMCLNFQNHMSVEDQYRMLKRVQSMEFDYYLTSHHISKFPKKMLKRMVQCMEHSREGKYYAYQYPRPPYAKGWIYLDSMEEEPVAVIVSEEERAGGK